MRTIKWNDFFTENHNKSSSDTQIRTKNNLAKNTTRIKKNTHTIFIEKPHTYVPGRIRIINAREEMNYEELASTENKWRRNCWNWWNKNG